MNEFVRLYLEQAAKGHNTTVKDIISKSRYAEHTSARWEVFYRLAHERQYTACRIAQLFGYHFKSVQYGIVRHAMINNLDCRFKFKRANACPVQGVGVSK